MSPWNVIDNESFHLCYNHKIRHYKLTFRLGRKLYTLDIKLQPTELVDDRLHDSGNVSPHHTGIYYNWGEDDLNKLPLSKRIAELNRRKIERERSGTRHNVG